MRRRAADLMRQAAGLVATGSRAAGTLAGGGAARHQRLAPLAAALHEGGGGGSNGSNGAGRNGSSPPPPPPFSSQAGGVGPPHLEAAVSAAVPEGWTPRQRELVRAIVAAKLAALEAHLAATGQRLFSLRSQPEQLEALGLEFGELKDQVLTKYGSGAEAMQQLAALLARKQVAAMMAGREEWARQQAQRRAGGAPAAAQGPAAAQQQQQQQQQQPQGSGYTPSWRQEKKAQDAAAAAQWRPQQEAAAQQSASLERTLPASSELAGDDGDGPFAERRTEYQAALQAQQGQQGQRAPPVRASIRDLLNNNRIRLPAYSPGTYNHQQCPQCMGGDKGEKSLSVTIEEGSDKAVWNCFRAKCGWTGSVDTRQNTSNAYRQYTNDAGFAVTAMRKRKEEAPLRPTPSFDAALSQEVVDFFAARGISAETLARNRVAQETLADGSKAIAFPYYRDGQLVNIKYRSAAEKKFWQVKGAEKVLYGLDDIVGASDIVIVEGEADKLAFEEAGFRNVVSVPDGAPARVKEGGVPPAEQDTKFSYLWNCRAWLDAASKIVIATDNDAPGDALAEELARRLGRERCWRVRWPLNEEDHQYAAEMAGVAYARQPGAGAEAPADGGAAALDAAAATALDGLADGEASSGDEEAAGGVEALPPRVQPAFYRKDANEVLLKDGAAMVKAFLDNAEPFPIRGLLRFHEYYDDILQYYRLEHKDGQGRSTGWPSLDALYKVVPGELTIVTGVPNSGKSEWIDALLANLAEQHDWCFALCSMEKKATDHARQLVEKYIGKPFFDLPYARGVRRMSERELDEGLDWIDDRFHLVRYEDDALPAVDWVLDVARAAVYRYGIRGLVIDPYNELDHQRPPSMNETEYVSQMLTKVKRFAQTTGVHVWFVAHPRQLREWKGQAPNLYDISGSAHFINKADNGIVVHRDRDPDSPDQHKVHIMVRKVRNKAAGTIGDAVLEYERVNGRYIDPDNPSGGPRTAQRVDFTAYAREERLQALRAEQRFEQRDAAAAAAAAAPLVPDREAEFQARLAEEAARNRKAKIAAALEAELADAALAGASASFAPEAPAPTTPAAATFASAVAQQQRGVSTLAATWEQQQQLGTSPPPQQQRAASPPPPPEQPQLAMRVDADISRDPVTDPEEIASWLGDN